MRSGLRRAAFAGIAATVALISFLACRSYGEDPMADEARLPPRDPGTLTADDGAALAPRDAGPDTGHIVVDFGGFRAWGDGTHAASCEGYMNPSAGEHTYAGATGDGVYLVEPDDAGAVTKVLCDMTKNDGGWTLIMASAPAERTTPATATAQTPDCTTPTAYCNVGGRRWPYETLRETWTGCPSAEAEIARSAYEDDKGACTNTVDSLVVTWGTPGAFGNGMKVWNDCGATCGGQTYFASECGAGPTLCVSAPLRPTTTGLVSSSGNCNVAHYSCPTGHDNIWLR
jgi:hypothetical protein